MVIGAAGARLGERGMSRTGVLERKKPGPMKCPECSSRWTGVIRKRMKPFGLSCRRYMCANCLHRWDTYEQASDKLTPVQDVDQLYRRWLNVHDIRSIGERAVRQTA